MSTIHDFSGQTPTWCPGCGDWAIGRAIKSSFVELGFDPSDVFVVFGIGCSGNMNDFLNAYAIHALHGRGIPNAIGMKLANHTMPVVAIVGDGDCYGEGGNHFIHACRGNHDITVVVHDNGVYGLTTGQVAPTGSKGMKSKSTPSGIIETPINPLTLALSQGATFVAQSFAGDFLHVQEMITKGIKHKGFSLINVLQPCVTFNPINTYHYYIERVYKVDASHDTKDFEKSLIKTSEMSFEKFPIGVIYDVDRPTFHEQALHINAKETLLNKKRFTDFEILTNEFR